MIVKAQHNNNNVELVDQTWCGWSGAVTSPKRTVVPFPVGRVAAVHGRLGSSGRTLTHEGPFASLTRDWIGRSESKCTFLLSRFSISSIFEFHSYKQAVPWDQMLQFSEILATSNSEISKAKLMQENWSQRHSCLSAKPGTSVIFFIILISVDK